MKLLLHSFCVLFCVYLVHARGKPNLIYIVCDDLGYGDLGCYGQKVIKTPRFDRMAKEGLRFTDHYAGHTVCRPHASSTWLVSTPHTPLSQATTCISCPRVRLP